MKTMSFAVRATDRCNLNCKYCYAKTKVPQNMSLTTLAKVISEIASCCDNAQIVVSWTGGEPLLMGLAFFEKAVELQKKTGKSFVNIVQTNGTLLTDEWYTFIKDNHFSVRTSLDLPPELHNEMRTTGNFDDTVCKIKKMQAMGIEVNVNTVITDRNIGEAEQIYECLKRLKVTSFSMSRLVMQGNAKENPELDIKQNSEFGRFLVKMYDLWMQDKEEPLIRRITPLDKLIRACDSHLNGGTKDPCFHCQDQLVAINPTGDVYPSCNKFFGLPDSCIGNIENQSLAMVLTSDKRKEFLNDVKVVTDKMCSKCEFLPICEGGCFYIAYNARHKLDKIDKREQFCKGYYIILARILEDKKGP